MKLRFSPSCCFQLLISINISCRNGNTSSGYISISPRVQSFATKNISIEKKEEYPVNFRSKMLDIGTCKKDTIVSFSYNFTNNGRRNILIEKIIGSCGCLAFDYTKTEICHRKNLQFM
jgi:hypothetical protein